MEINASREPSAGSLKYLHIWFQASMQQSVETRGPRVIVWEVGTARTDDVPLGFPRDKGALPLKRGKNNITWHAQYAIRKKQSVAADDKQDLKCLFLLRELK